MKKLVLAGMVICMAWVAYAQTAGDVSGVDNKLFDKYWKVE